MFYQGKGTCSTKPLTMERSYLSHYRDTRVSNWASLSIKYVKFAFYDRFHEVAYVIFSGNGSSLNSWFDKSRVISSSWPDLTSTSTYNVFSLYGYVILHKNDRRFYISKSHGGCSAGTGHIAVINNGFASPDCTWETHKSYPQFLYSKLNSVNVWQRQMYGAADFLTIFIKR